MEARVLEKTIAEVFDMLEGRTLEAALDIATTIVWVCGRSVHGSSKAAEADGVFMTAHHALVAVRRRVREAARASGGTTFVFKRPDQTRP